MITLIKSDKLAVLTDDPVISKSEVPHVATLFDAGSQLTEIADGLQEKMRISVRQGYAKGFETGRNRGQQKGRDDISQHMLRMTKKMEQDKQELQADVVQLSMQVVRKIAAALGPEEVVAALAETAVYELLGNGDVTMLVHPAVLTSGRQRFLKLKNDFSDSGSQLEIRADDSLKPFDCILRTELGTTVAGLDAQLDNLQQAMSA